MPRPVGTKTVKKDLVQIIRDNPGCVAVIDNDCWYLRKNNENAPEDDAEYDKWLEQATLARSEDDLIRLGDGGYGLGHCYGGDILQALAAIVGVKVESV